MDKKDSKKFESLYRNNDDNSLRTFEEIEERLYRDRAFYINEFTEERKKAEFEESYKYISQLNVFNKDYAEKLIRDINLGPNSYSTRSKILTYGMYHAYKTNDMSILKNALHTLNRLTYSCVLDLCSGYNHSGAFENVIYAFADCDIELVKRLFPKEHGLADKNTHPFYRPSCNLIMGMIYENDEWKEEAQNQAIIFLERKSSKKNDILVVKYLLALSRKDIAQASLFLQEIADNYRKMSWLFNFKNEFLKFFAVYVHGLYYMAHFVLSEELFKQIILPEHSVFWKDFDSYTKETNFSTGKSIFEWKGDTASLNYLFEF